MVQPNTEARPRRARTRRGEEQAPLVESQLSVTNDVLMEGEEGSGLAHHRADLCDVAVSLTPPPEPPPCPASGIDGPAAFLEASELGMKIQIASASQQPPPSLTPAADVPERNGDAGALPEPKTDIQELLQKQGRPKRLSSEK